MCRHKRSRRKMALRGDIRRKASLVLEVPALRPGFAWQAWTAHADCQQRPRAWCFRCGATPCDVQVPRSHSLCVLGLRYIIVRSLLPLRSGPVRSGPAGCHRRKRSGLHSDGGLFVLIRPPARRHVRNPLSYADKSQCVAHPS